MSQRQFDHLSDFLHERSHASDILVRDCRHSALLELHALRKFRQDFQLGRVSDSDNPSWIGACHHETRLSWERSEKELVKIETEEVLEQGAAARACELLATGRLCLP